MAFDIQLPYDKYDHKKTFCINALSIHVVGPSNQAVAHLKGQNDLSDKMMKSCYCFKSVSQSTGVDYTIILWEISISTKQANVLLLFRFHNLKDYSDEFVSNFFRNLIEKNREIRL